MNKAILLATGYAKDSDPLLHFRPSPLLTIVNKPIIFHIIECLVQLGIEQYEIVLNYLPHLIEDKVGDGTRWGVKIRYHLAKDALYPFKAISPTIQQWDEEHILWGQGDCLPAFTKELIKENRDNSETSLFYHNNEWSGWGIVPLSFLKSIPINESERAFLTQEVRSQMIKLRPFLSAKNLPQLKKSNLRLLRFKKSPVLFPSSSRMVEPGIWISRGVSMHPSVKIVPPVFIGEYCQIKEKSQIGPYAVIENNCIIDNGSLIERSLILSHSFVGESLEIKNSIVDRNLLINLSFETVLRIRDDFILGEISTPKVGNSLINFLEKITAAIILVIFSPIFLILLFSLSIVKKKMLQIPASIHREEWQTFDFLSFQNQPGRPMTTFQRFFRRLPSLINVLKGEIHIVGLIPRSIHDVDKLPLDWKKLYLQSKIGLITLSNLEYGPSVSMEDRYACEMYYSIHMNSRYDFKLFIKWLIKKLNDVKKFFLLYKEK